MKKFGILLVAVFLISILVLAGCGSEETAAPSTVTTTTTATTTSTTTATTTTTSTVTASVPGQPEYGGTLKRYLGADVGSPFGVPWEMTPFGHGLAMPALEHLMYEDGDGTLHGFLATDWEIAADKMSITLNLRQGVKFHDGTDWDAEAAKWNIDQWIDAGIDPASYFDSVDIVGDYAIRINFTQWTNTILPYALAGWNAEMISPTSFEQNGIEWARTHPVGTGPFQFVSYTPDVDMVYERFDGYWEEGKPYLNGIEYIVIPDVTTASIAFKSGEVHELSGLAPSAITAELRDTGYDQVTTDHLVNTIDILVPSSGNPDSPFSDIRVREAVAYALNREAIVNAVGFGFFKAAYQLAPSNHKAYQTNLIPRTYDVARAKELLAEAGYADGFDTRIIPNPFVISKDTCVAIQGLLAEVGINASVDFLDYGQFADMIYTSGWDGLIAEKSGLFPSMTKGLQFYYSGAPGRQFTPSVEYPEGFREAYDAALATVEPEVDKVQECLRLLYEGVTIIPYAETPMRAFLYPGVHEADEDLQYDIPPYTTSTNAWMENDIQ